MTETVPVLRCTCIKVASFPGTTLAARDFLIEVTQLAEDTMANSARTSQDGDDPKRRGGKEAQPAGAVTVADTERLDRDMDEQEGLGPSGEDAADAYQGGFADTRSLGFRGQDPASKFPERLVGTTNPVTPFDRGYAQENRDDVPDPPAFDGAESDKYLFGPGDTDAGESTEEEEDNR
jgi:hypothetical protein